MTVIENLQPRVQYTYSTASQLYNITFPYIERQYVKCMVRDQVLEYNTHYQVPVFDPVSLDEDELYLNLLITPNADLDDGVTIEDGDLITIYRETPIDQQAEFPQTAKFSSQKITEALDKLTLQQQEQQDDITRCLKLAKNVPDGFETSLPVPVSGNYIRWSEDGTQLINYDLEEDMNNFKQDVNDTVEEFEEEVNETLTDFQGQINNIRGTANEAVNIANGAVDTADEALETAETAESNSQTAINTANTASSNASSALNTASTAVGTANTALTKANTAVNTANTADTNASTALNKANQAITDSATAISTAEDAVETAEDAVDKAEDAVDKATTAVNTASTANTNATNAVNTANTANTNSQTAISTANTANTNSQTAVNTANSANSKVDEFGEDIESVIAAAEKINELEEAVETAVEAAEDATTAATNATTAATNATTAATNASDAATTATQKAQEATQAAASIVLDTYRVVYGVTTYNQVATAITNNKVPLLDTGNNKYGILTAHYYNASITVDEVIYSGACYVFQIISGDGYTATLYYLFNNNDWVSDTTNLGTVRSVNNIQPVNGNITLSIPAAVTESTVSGWGFTKTTGTVTSVNNIQPDANGNVVISGGANTDLSNLTATGEAHFQKPLVSGTNIKTINNTSLLGSGNIDTLEVFIATYGTTTYQEVSAAYRAGKIIKCKFIETTATGPIDELSLVVGNISTGRFLFAGTPNSYGRYQTASLWDGVGWHSYTIVELQKASTAVTHPENTAIGDYVTPVYINSNGIATSTGLSIASSRFDGQWVAKNEIVFSQTAVGTYICSLTNYLPDSTYAYEILINLEVEYNSGVTTARLSNANDSTAIRYYVRCSGNSRIEGIHCVLPFSKVQRNLYLQIADNKAASQSTYLLGYRRVGTNS